MAGAGFMTFTDGQVLTAAQVNTYLMEQSVMVFATAAARTTALPTPSEGMVTYRTDANIIEYYDGAAWQPILDQDVIQAKGDLIVGTGDDAVARLAVGTNGQFLSADSSTATGLKWAGAATAYTSLASGTLTSGTSLSLTSISASYQVLELWLYGVECASDFTASYTVNNDTTTNYRVYAGFGTSSVGTANAANIAITASSINNTGGLAASISIPNYSRTGYKIMNFSTVGPHATNAGDLTPYNSVLGLWYSTAIINRIDVTFSQTLTAGNYILWGIT